MQATALFFILLFAAGSFLAVAPWVVSVGKRRSMAGKLSYLRELRPKPALVRRWEAMRQRRGLSGGRLKLEMRLKSAGVGLTAKGFRKLVYGMMGAAAFFVAAAYAVDASVSLEPVPFPIVKLGMALGAAWFLPQAALMWFAAKRRTRLLYEISRLSHRLSICYTGKEDLRTTVLRAGRTLREMQPYLNELAAGWNRDQRKAILAFGDRIGLTEAFPLVNVLLAASTAEDRELAAMLEQQTESIDRTLEHEIVKKIENVPLLLVLLIMIPFMAVFILMVYPWVSYMTELMLKSF